jgi:hypothetical protein
MKASGIEQKLIQKLTSVRNGCVMNGLQPISAGVDIAYEAGRRIGAREGMDLMVKATIEFFTDAEAKDESL